MAVEGFVAWIYGYHEITRPSRRRAPGTAPRALLSFGGKLCAGSIVRANIYLGLTCT